jgi:hypothetical protein
MLNTMIQELFDWYCSFLSKSGKIMGLTYEELNILMYFYLPLILWVWLLIYRGLSRVDLIVLVSTLGLFLLLGSDFVLYNIGAWKLALLNYDNPHDMFYVFVAILERWGEDTGAGYIWINLLVFHVFWPLYLIIKFIDKRGVLLSVQ